MFFEAAASLNPNSLSPILQAHPYHVNTLLQLSHVFSMSNDMQTAHDFIERALYCFEVNFHPMFNTALGTCRLDYNHYENRALFLTLFRHVHFVSQRGCWRTALECCKLLLSLSPENDPLGALLIVDYLSLRSGEYHFLERFFKEWNPTRNLLWLPNFAFSMALMQYFYLREGIRHGGSADLGGAKREEKSKNAKGEAKRQGGAVEDDVGLRQTAIEALADALLRFPDFLPLLSEKLDARFRPHLSSHSLFTLKNIEGHASLKAARLLVVLYLERAHSLWKPTDVLDWVQVCVCVCVCVCV